MPPHCDSMDGPVVKAAIEALERRDVTIILPYVPEDAEDEVRAAYDKVSVAREESDTAREVADRWFFETVVRLHRAGEGAAFTGLKPAGLGHGEVVPVAERVIESGDVSDLVELLSSALRDEIARKFANVVALKQQQKSSVADAREYVEAKLGFMVWAHKAHICMHADPLHDHAHAE